MGDPPGVSAAGAPSGALTFASAREASSDARTFVARVLTTGGCPTSFVDDGRTVASELVVEALSRGWMPRRLAVLLGPRHLRLDLRAEGRAAPLGVPTARRTSQELVEGLCVRSGSRPLGDGRRWWAVLERPVGRLAR